MASVAARRAHGYSGYCESVFGLTFEKLLLIGIIAVFLLGPDRLPYYAQKLADLVKSLRKMATGAKERMREELGPDFDDVDWQKLDPRQYDPRRIIREALLDDEPPARVVRPKTPVETPASKRDRLARESAKDRAADPVSVPGDPAPYDTEAT
jgi:sec-independent protein translocase protein TatB